MFVNILNREEKIKKYYYIALLVFMIIASTITAEASNPKWYKVSFSAQQEKNFSNNCFNALVVREIVMPILKYYNSEYEFFFFENSYKKNNHCFVFYFFAKKKYAHRIFQVIKDNQVTKIMRKKILSS